MKELNILYPRFGVMSENQENPISLNELPPDLDLEPWQREVVGMWRAINLVHSKATSGPYGFSDSDVLAIHKFVLNDPFNPHFSGTLRKVLVKIGSSVRGQYREADFIPVRPEELPERFAQFSGELEERTSKINADTNVGDIIENASWAHLELLRLHPFIDGNGRTARLLVDFIFKRGGLPYITDWGAENDEYKDVVDRTFKQDPTLFKKFLAEKLIKRSNEVTSLRSRLAKPMAEVRQQASEYLSGLSLNAA